MPETRSSHWLMRAATSSVELTLPELMAMNWLDVVREVLVYQLLGVVDDADGGDGVQVPGVSAPASGWGSVSLMQPMPLHPWNSSMSFSNGAERGVLDGVDLALETRLAVMYDHAGTARAEVRVIVHAKEHVEHDVAMRRHSKETAHGHSLLPKWPAAGGAADLRCHDVSSIRAHGPLFAGLGRLFARRTRTFPHRRGLLAIAATYAQQDGGDHHDEQGVTIDDEGGDLECRQRC